MEGCIQLIMGPMFSGKTTELLRRVRRYDISGKKVSIIKYKGDDRYMPDLACTHDEWNRHPALSVSTLSELDDNDEIKNADIIAVDEGNLFPDLVQFCESFANAGKTVIVAALDSTYLREPFPTTAQLIPKAEKVDKLSAICVGCGDDAYFTRRIVESDELELIGGADKYKAVCRRCYYTHESIQ